MDRFEQFVENSENDRFGQRPAKNAFFMVTILARGYFLNVFDFQLFSHKTYVEYVFCAISITLPITRPIRKDKPQGTRSDAIIKD